MIPGGEVKPPRRGGAERPAAFVIHRRAARQHRREPGAPRLQAEIEILEREEVVLVEEPGGVEHVAPDVHQTTAHGVYRLVCVP